MNKQLYSTEPNNTTFTEYIIHLYFPLAAATPLAQLSCNSDYIKVILIMTMKFRLIMIIL